MYRNKRKYVICFNVLKIKFKFIQLKDFLFFIFYSIIYLASTMVIIVETGNFYLAESSTRGAVISGIKII